MTIWVVYEARESFDEGRHIKETEDYKEELKTPRKN
jgi:hypothetical protein